MAHITVASQGSKAAGLAVPAAKAAAAWGVLLQPSTRAVLATDSSWEAHRLSIWERTAVLGAASAALTSHPSKVQPGPNTKLQAAPILTAACAGRLGFMPTSEMQLVRAEVAASIWAVRPIGGTGGAGDAAPLLASAAAAAAAAEEKLARASVADSTNLRTRSQLMMESEFAERGERLHAPHVHVGMG